MTKTAIERFEAKIEPEPNSGCWLWAGARTGRYGWFWDGAKYVRAHRWAYQFWRGEIPAGTEPDHLCRVPPCVNPCHLEVVTHRENTRRGLSGQVRVTYCPRGHLKTGTAIGRCGRRDRIRIYCLECHNAYHLARKD